MEYCHHEQPNRTNQTASGLLALVFLGASLFPLEALLHSRSFLAGCFYAVYVIFFWLIAACFAFCYLMDSRKYTVTEEGVVLQYFGKIKALYPWDCVKEIGICKINYTTRSAAVSYLTVLRLVTIDEKNGPRKGYGFWATAYYTMFHWRSIITISFTEDRHQQFLSVCPSKVVDYRHIKRYWHDEE